MFNLTDIIIPCVNIAPYGVSRVKDLGIWKCATKLFRFQIILFCFPVLFTQKETALLQIYMQKSIPVSVHFHYLFYCNSSSGVEYQELRSTRQKYSLSHSRHT